jgi:hypothetical protein
MGTCIKQKGKIMKVVTAADSTWSGQCGKGRTYLSKEYPDPEMCLSISDKALAENWEDERDGCIDGNYKTCLKGDW